MINHKNENDISSLTDREIEIIVLIADGLSNKEIGTRLFIAERTVKTHLANIKEKTATRNRVEVALYYHGILKKVVA